jgi:hypothetical protein
MYVIKCNLNNNKFLSTSDRPPNTEVRELLKTRKYRHNLIQHIANERKNIGKISFLNQCIFEIINIYAYENYYKRTKLSMYNWCIDNIIICIGDRVSYNETISVRMILDEMDEMDRI